MFAFLVFAWVFALFGVGVFAWGGGTLCVPPPLALAVLWWAGFWRSRSGVGVKSVWASARATSMGRDVVVPPPLHCWVVLSPPAACAWKRKRG